MCHRLPDATSVRIKQLTTTCMAAVFLSEDKKFYSLVKIDMVDNVGSYL